MATFNEKVVEAIEAYEPADRLAKPLQEIAGRLVAPRAVRNLLSGTNVGHPLHPMLTDVPIGAWLSAALLDVVGGRGSRRAADLLVAAGIIAAVPTAATGLNDFSDTYGAETRLGLAHAAGNVAAVTLYGMSLAARLAGRRKAGRKLGFTAFATMLGGAYLGGHLSFARGVNVNHTAFEHRPTDWTPVAADEDLAEGATRRVLAGDAPVLLRREGGRLYALAATCSHMGGPLDEGSFAGGRVTCPWHGSEFRLDDGAVVRGPASQPQPLYDARVVEGRVEVRARR